MCRRSALTAIDQSSITSITGGYLSILRTMLFAQLANVHLLLMISMDVAGNAWCVLVYISPIYCILLYSLIQLGAYE